MQKTIRHLLTAVAIQACHMLKRTRRHRLAARSIVRQQHIADRQKVHLAAAQRQNAGDATVDDAVAAFVAAAVVQRQVFGEQAAALEILFVL